MIDIAVHLDIASIREFIYLIVIGIGVFKRVLDNDYNYNDWSF